MLPAKLFKIVGGTLCGNLASILRDGGTHCYPGRKVVRRCVGQFLFWRHFKVLNLIADHLDEQALVGFSRDEKGPAVSTTQNPCFAVQIERRLQLGGLTGMALVTVSGENRPDVILEIVDAFFGRRGGSQQAACERSHRRQYRKP